MMDKKIFDESDMQILKQDENYIEKLIDNLRFYNDKEVRKMLKLLIEFTKENNLQLAYSWILYKLGSMFMNEDKYDEAEIYLNKAYEIFCEKDYIVGMMAVCSSFMGCKTIQGSYGDGIKWGRKGMNLAEASKNYEYLMILKGNMAAIFLYNEEYDKAIEVLEQIEDLPWNGSEVSKVAYQLNRVICEREKNNLEKAQYYLEKTKDLVIKMPRYYCNWLNEYGKTYIKKGMYDEAEKLLKKVIELSDENDSPEYKYESILALSEIDVMKERYIEAIEKLKSIEGYLEEVGILISLKPMYKNFNKAFLGLKDYKNAYYYLEKFNQSEEKIREIKEENIINFLDEQKSEMEEKNYKVLYEQNQKIYRIGQKITANLNKSDILMVIAEQIKYLVKYDTFQIAIYDETTNRYQYQLVIEEDKILDLENSSVSKGTIGEYCINTREDIILNDIVNEYSKYIIDPNKYNEFIKKINKVNEDKFTSSLIMTPMIINEKVLGILCIQSYEKKAYDLKDLISLKILSTYIGIAIENSRLYKTVEYNANYDSLTGVYNRRVAIEKINQIMTTESSYNYYIGMIDVDNFKNINDEYGHIVGDKVLIAVAKEIEEYLNEFDIVARYGGEEFMVAIRDKNRNIKNIMEGLRENIERLYIKIKENKFVNVTISIGVKLLNKDNMTIEDNIALADKCLYEAKKSGKNKVVF